MGRPKRLIYDVDRLHTVPHDDLRDAVEYLGGVLVEGYDPDRPTECVLQWSPYAAKAMRPQLARTVYSSWQTIPVYVVDQIMAAYTVRKAEHEAAAKAAAPRCRSCKARGVDMLATHDLCDSDGNVLAERSLCWFCHDRLRGVKIPPPPLPMGDRICERCAAQLYLTPNVREQIDVAGRFTGLCPACWKSKRSAPYLNADYHEG